MDEQQKNLFIEGAISGILITEIVQKYSAETKAGGHSIFLGQVRTDEKEGQEVQAIEFTAYQEMGIKKMAQIREEIIAKYELIGLHAYHSLGIVQKGEICLFAFTCSQHRKSAMAACSELVERLKKELPLWGKEIYSDGSYQWKENR
ncbi:MAG: molybdenum cofactor biosynthesis protein MoaE [Candidatus Azobacteroides sp.]|nr:molybdenum cofactor biosynthesis protein MoaE [Candidatus Azobacteroides sp.]